MPLSALVPRLEAAADGPGAITFLGSAAGADGPQSQVSWRALHDDARGFAAALAGPRHRARNPCGDPRPHHPAARHRHPGHVAVRRGNGDAPPADATRLDRRVRRADASAHPLVRRRARDRRPATRRVPRPRRRRSPDPAPRRARRRTARHRRVRPPGRRPRPARDPAVHERVDVRPEGRDPSAPLRDGERRRHRAGRPVARRCGPRCVVAAAVPRHGPDRAAHHPHDHRHGPRTGRAAGLPRRARAVDAVVLGLRRDRERGPELRLRARRARVAPALRPRPVAVATRAERRGADRSGRRRGLRPRRRAARTAGVRGVPGLRHGRGDARDHVPRAGLRT